MTPIRRWERGRLVCISSGITRSRLRSLVRRLRYRRARARADYADDIDVQRLANRRQRQGRSRVARYDEKLDSARRQKLRILDCITLNRRQ